MEKQKNNKLCIIIVPSNDKVKRLTIPSWLPKVILISIGVISIALLFTYKSMDSSYNALMEKYKEKTTEASTLKEENEVKDIQIYNLKSKADEILKKSEEIDNKLMEIDKLKRQLEKMAGIESSSRSSTFVEQEELETLETTDEIQILVDKLSYTEKELEDFIVEIEDRFEYLETVPDLWPTYGRLTSTFGLRKDPFGSGTTYHKGIDIANSVGTNIIASAKGVVTFTGYKSSYGYTVIIDHNNEYETLYAHLSKILVSVGDTVEKGQIIAKMGNTGRSTGPHLHFEIHKYGSAINPLSVLK